MGRATSGARVLALVAPGVLLALDPAGWYPYGPAKWLAVSVLVPLGAALLWSDGPLRCDRRLGLAVLALLALLGAAAAVGADPTYAWVGTPERFLGVLTWVLCAIALLAGQSLRGERDVRWVVGGLVVAGVGVGAVAAAEALGWSAGPIGTTGDRLGGTFGSAAYLGAATALLLPVALGVALDAGWGRRSRVLAGSAAATLLVACVGAGARAAWVGLVVAAAAVGWSHRHRVAGHGRAVAVGAALAVAGLGVVALATPAGERVTSAFDADSPGGRGRLDEWRVAARVVAAHPLLGVGPEGYRTAFAEGADAAYERNHGRDPLPDRAHSGLVDVALAGGLGAAAAWLVALGLIARSLRSAVRAGRPWLVGAAAGLVAHWAGQLLLFPTMELEPVAWLLAGVVVTASTDLGDRDRAGAWVRDVPRSVGVLLGALAATALLTGVAGLVADRAADRAAEALARGDAAAARRWSGEAVDRRPDVVRDHLLDARARVAAGEGTVSGLAAVDDALAVSPRDPIAERERARLLVDRARATQVPAHVATARRYLDGLLERDPVNAALWSLAADAARLDGDAPAAARADRRAAELAPR